MTDVEWVYRCDYCGVWTPVDQSVTLWTPVDELDDGRTVAIPATYCGYPCAGFADARAGSARG